jgi:phosphatidylglycerol---prolipoprotein diacylglyceryl transferase
MSWYGFFIGIAIVIFIEYFQKNNKIITKKSENIFLFFLITLSFISARLYYVLVNLDYYLLNPSEILNTRAGGMGILGGIIASIIYILIYCKTKKINFTKLTDSFITIIPLCQAIGRIGNIINKEIYPISIYELIFNFILFLILLKTKKHQTAIFLIGYSLIRLVTEQFRTDALPFFLGSIFSLLGILIGIILLNDKYFSRRQQHCQPKCF